MGGLEGRCLLLPQLTSSNILLPVVISVSHLSSVAGVVGSLHIHKVSEISLQISLLSLVNSVGVSFHLIPECAQ